MHRTRLRAVVQALAADARVLQAEASLDPWCATKLTSLFRRLTAISYERQTGYIVGLSVQHTADWRALADRWWREVARYDADAAACTGVTLARHPERKGDEVRPLQTASPFTPRLARIWGRASRMPFVVVGGLRDPHVEQELERLVRGDVEWCESSESNPRAADAVTARIAGGKVAAVLLLHGKMGHWLSNKVIGACSTAGVPFVRCKSAGSGQILGALATLEERLAPRKAS